MDPITAAQLEAVYIATLNYYTSKILRHGPTPRGVDWSDELSQEIRFKQLLKVCQVVDGLTLNDVGCGYGALLCYLAKDHPNISVIYTGVDLSASMIREAERSWTGRHHIEFAVGTMSPRSANYSLASGIFNVKLNETRDVWEGYIAHTLRDLLATSERGFAVNFKKQSPDLARPGLYVAHPPRWIDYCERQLNCNVQLVTDYGLDEFTLLVHRRD
jgi:SAM-dependent methyltransferase